MTRTGRDFACAASLTRQPWRGEAASINALLQNNNKHAEDKATPRKPLTEGGLFVNGSAPAAWAVLLVCLRRGGGVSSKQNVRGRVLRSGLGDEFEDSHDYYYTFWHAIPDQLRFDINIWQMEIPRLAAIGTTCGTNRAWRPPFECLLAVPGGPLAAVPCCCPASF